MEDEGKTSRRKFLKFGVVSGVAAAAGVGLQKVLSDPSSAIAAIPQDSGEKMNVLAANGQLMQVNVAHAQPVHHAPVSNEEARKGSILRCATDVRSVLPHARRCTLLQRIASG